MSSPSSKMEFQPHGIHPIRPQPAQLRAQKATAAGGRSPPRAIQDGTTRPGSAGTSPPSRGGSAASLPAAILTPIHAISTPIHAISTLAGGPPRRNRPSPIPVQSSPSRQVSFQPHSTPLPPQFDPIVTLSPPRQGHASPEGRLLLVPGLPSPEQEIRGLFTAVADRYGLTLF